MASALPSLADALVLVVLIVPGFVVVRVFARVTAFDRKLSEFDLTVLSFIASLIVYLPFSYITSLDSVDKIRDAVLMPQTIGLLLSLSFAMGLLPGLVVKKWFRARHSHGPVWDAVVKDRPDEEVYVLVHTALDQEIMGRLHSVGTGDSPKDLRLLDPVIVIRDKGLNARKQIRLGKELYLSEKDVQSVAFL